MRQSAKRSNLRSAMRLSGTALALALAGCATQPPPAMDGAPGLLSGFVHGLVAIPALLASLALEVRVYAFPNSGFWYDLGFCGGFGLGMALLALPIIPFIGGYLTRRN
jgi:hypothetical protein